MIVSWAGECAAAVAFDGVLPNRHCSWRWIYGTRGGTRFARVHRAILLDSPQLNAIR